MRLISQDGTVDIPYDLSALFIDEFELEIDARFSNSCFSMGSYKNKEDAKDVLAMVREASSLDVKNFKFP